MSDDKTSIDTIVTLAPNWVFLLSAIAGLVGFLEEIKPEETLRIKLLKFVTRIVSSAFAGIMTYQVMLALGIPTGWLISMTGIGAHMGVETMKILGKIYKKKIGAEE